MADLSQEQLQAYLREVHGPDARLLHVGELGVPGEQGLKDFGYGKPLGLVYEVGGERREAVLSTMRGDAYGHQFVWDRAAILMFQHECGGRMERHVKPVGLGYLNHAGELHPTDDVEEFFLVTDKVQGHDYYMDLERIRAGRYRPSDLSTARAFARWLARVHAVKRNEPALYLRRVRELVGASECIMGLVDHAFPHPWSYFTNEQFMALEKRLIDWRWKFRDHTARLCAVHGDFHPWNVLVRDPEEGAARNPPADAPLDFSVLDRSRGEWGEAADDVATMAMNYALFGIMDRHRLDGPFLELYLGFVEEYLEASGDTEILRLMAPFFVFRALVIASPQWYPRHPKAVRQALVRFMVNVLEDEVYDYRDVNRYMEWG